MKELKEKELNNITGGIGVVGKFMIAGGIIAFLIGIIDGFTRPLKCNK